MSDEHELVRPFMGRPTDAAAPAGAARAARLRSAPSSGDDSIRPYLITRGRVSASRDIRIETQVRTSRFGESALPAQHFERADILELCSEPMSVAEISARLGLALGVSRVLVSDLRSEGFVSCSDGPADARSDTAMIKRLIDGVRAL
ncbi:MAG TPA: DUF742 domain-containing protein [Acidimicrobiia bacterium]|jgi:hypothetical protein